MGSEAELHTLIEQDEEGDVSGPQLESPTTETVNDGRIAIITDLTVLAIEVVPGYNEGCHGGAEKPTSGKAKGAAAGSKKLVHGCDWRSNDNGVYLARLVEEKVGSFVRMYKSH